MGEIVNDKALDAIFRQGRSHSFWLDKPVSDVTLQAVYDLMRYGPTSANCSRPATGSRSGAALRCVP